MTRNRPIRATAIGGRGRLVQGLVVAVLALTWWATAVRERAEANAASLSSAIEREVRFARQFSRALGVHVVDLSTGEEVYAYRPDQQRIIASNTKLFTTAAALDLLGPAHFFETRVMFRGELDAGVLSGDLAVVGGGDPNISGRHYDGDPLAIFRGWAEQLRARGIRRVAGDLFLVDGLFESSLLHPDWPSNQMSRWYQAPVSALSFSDNCVLVRVRPGPRPGSPARVEVTPDLPIFEVRNAARTASSAKSHVVSIRRLDGTNVLTVTGQVYRGAGPVESWVTVADPVRYFGEALRKALRESGIEVAGAIRASRSLPGVDVWHEALIHRVDLLSTLEVINKRSQNFYAESLLKAMGARFCDQGSWEAGRRVVSEFIDRVGIARGSYELADGSGMSRNNRFTPRQITELLRYMFLHPLASEFVLSLPYSGEEGLSWEKRLNGPAHRANVFAKTGGLRSVSTLSGYAKAGSGKVYAFGILCNETTSRWEAKRAQDRIVAALIEHG